MRLLDAPVRPTSLVPVLLGVALTCAAPAQVPEPAIARPIPALGADWRVPIHAAPDPSGPSVERWAAAAGYKASFHDGFVFYPVLGAAAPRHLPLRWETESVRAGERELTGVEPPVHHHGEWRYEYRRAHYTEAYDVRVDGVEQTFTFPGRAGSGDLVVRGRVTTALTAAPVGGEHAGLVFRDADGRAVIEYGAAVVLDAAGRSQPIHTTFDGTHVELRVPAAWLDEAVFPVVIDPLTSSRLIVPAGGNVVHVDSAREDVSTSRNVLLCYLREVTSTDRDVYAYLHNEDFTQPALVYSNTGTSTCTAPRTAFVPSPGRWVIAYREAPAGATGAQPRVTIHVFDRQSTRLNVGTALTVPASYGTPTSVSVGGARTGDRGMVAFVSYAQTGSTISWYVHCAVIDARTPYVERVFRLQALNRAPGAAFPDGVAINSAAADTVDGWLVTWLESPPSLSSFVLWGAKAYWNGQHSNPQTIELGSPPALSRPWRGTPVVEGDAGKYLIANRVIDDAIWVRRVDWPSLAATGTVGPRRVVTHPAISSRDNSYNLAFDTDTRSHWALAHHYVSGGAETIEVRRLGHTGGTVETRAIRSDVQSMPGVHYDSRSDSFGVSYHGSFGAVTGFLGAALEHDPTLGNVLYGTGCGGTISATTPFAGHDDWRVRLTTPNSYAPAALMLAFAPANVPFAGGCFVNVQLAAVLDSIPLATNEFGISELRFELPDAPVFVGDLYLQWAHLSGGAIALTRGLRAQVRP